jgi:hypothetical protein
MAYDLILRRQVPRNYSRDNPDPTISPQATGLASLGLVAAIFAIPRLLRTGEIHYYKHRLADDRADITREMPILSTYQLTGARLPRRRSSDRRAA